jgi:hypothetical protein
VCTISAVAEEYTLAFLGKYLEGEGGTLLDSGKTVDSRAKIDRFRPH